MSEFDTALAYLTGKALEGNGELQVYFLDDGSASDITISFPKEEKILSKRMIRELKYQAQVARYRVISEGINKYSINEAFDELERLIEELK